MSEFSIIKEYFEKVGGSQADVILGIGDDAALVKTDAVLAVSVDTFIENVHFPKATRPYDIGWKSLAVNLSDMAAMGAEPYWMTLAITMPEIDHDWLKEYCRGLSTLAQKHNVALIGGDTTRGPLSITIQIAGKVADGRALRRSDAQVGDGVYVTGYIGDGALGFRSLSQKLNLSGTETIRVQQKLNQPHPRVEEALALREFVNAAIDISDGLYADLGHILAASDKGAVLHLKDIPISAEYRWNNQGKGVYDLALTGGDDYELCMTVPVTNEQGFLDAAKKHEISVSKIGEITENKDYKLLIGAGEEYVLQSQAFEHFS